MQHTLSNKALFKSTVIALMIAGVVLISFILPAEYNIDPTGIGTQLGLTALANPEGTAIINTEQSEKLSTDAQHKTDSIDVIVPAGRGVEYKFAMAQFKKMEYQWHTDGAPLFFDLHGEPEGDTTGYYESYAIATLTEMKGSFTTPFAGIHGWYWKNTSNKPVTVQLTVGGEYSIVGLKK
ncbi:hypothetical protein [Colwellia psychrerythraea]|uniref:Transmembrane anchor protein n=1 Tax=Colwellia psychrerythraea TaxID=28229 RepID=A0A099KVI4_COLPS|nr:hypothetical protein [Colwellia psychrerythraea]KGJ94591.1 hypothetical protein ND2E_1780 [Colwellia psychrerythraea]